MQIGVCVSLPQVFMAHNYKNEAVERFLLPERPDEDNYTLTVAYEATLEVYQYDRVHALDECKHWKQQERAEDACREAEATKAKAAADARCQGGGEQVRKHPHIEEGEAGPSVERCKCCIAKGNILFWLHSPRSWFV